ncbi:MAG: bifunctional phosphopantothenoylcysteine decarboxylase/phosphopantothenate--cysteine ligase CoaBC [Zetaproteobacteria bacterium]|nr:MAG: bifunctional phosphopantothenoylcysteine decarboxylase/phosphopantothenate--cysteine ligase CoaBC [Zetaproteobacteria bacterium]
MELKGKRILLGVTGSIAAYKAVELLRLLTATGAEVQVVMTEGATKFVAPLTFETLTRQPVLLDMWSLAYSHRIGHIEATQRADLLVVAPATARTIARLALGLADDFLSCIYLASRCPVVLAPAMDCDMFEHPALQENLRRLRDRGVHVVEPDTGPLASGLVGRGRLAELSAILGVIERLLAPKGDLAGRVVLVTAGPTREPLDPVRFLSNRSSGKMGYAIAEAAAARGAHVILVSGPTALAPPATAETIHVETAEEMLRAVLAKLEIAHVVIKAAAVADYRPKRRADRKLKKEDVLSEVPLEPTPDILAEIGERKGNRIVVGFAAETDDLVANARKKLDRKHLDLVVANDVSGPGAGFDVDTNVVTILDASAGIEELPLLSKREVADRILDRVADLLHKKS